MKKRMFWSFFALSFSALILFTTITLFIIDDSYTQKTTEHLFSLTSLIAQKLTVAESFPAINYQADAVKLANTLGADVRVTFVDKAGKILGDSLSPEMYQNYSNRIEIIDAFKTGKGKNIRFSDTNGFTNICVAQKIDADLAVRISIPLQDSMDFVLLSLPMILMSLFLIGGIALFVSTRLSKKIIKPILAFSEKLDFSSPMSTESLAISVPYEELLPLARRFDDMYESLQKHVNELKDEGEQVNLILNKLREGVVILNIEKNVILINTRAQKLLGLAETSYDVHHNLLFYARNVELSDTIDLVIKTRETNILNVAENTFSDKALRFYISPVDGEGVVIIIRDITEILRAENIRSEFVANVSHELKTPITSIRGFAELLAEGKGDGTNVHGPAKIILEQADRLLSLVDGILLLSEFESKTYDSNLEEVDILAIAHEVAVVLEKQAEEKGVTISFSGKAVKYRANKNTVFELIMNLVDNAIKYNKQGGTVDVAVQMLETAQGTRSVEISVRDSGIGIPQGDLGRVFERFYCVDKSRSKRSGGTGLGLSIVKHIVELYKGEIEVESELGEYTLLKVRLGAR